MLWIGAGTKTGKTTALALWIADGILRGEPTAWIGPWSAKTKSAYDRIKEYLAPAIDAGAVKVNDSTMRMKSHNGGTFEPFTGDNPDAIFGDGYKRVVIDEASRQGEASLTAALTTIAATGGQIRIAYNLDRGAKNWAVRNLLRVRHLTPEQRTRQGEDCLTVTTASQGFVSPEVIEQMKGTMPAAMWRALFLAEIPESDTSLFRNLDLIFVGRALTEPEPGASYGAGIDLARKRDWTVITIIDLRTGAVVATDRFHEVSWVIQYERCAELYRRFRCTKAVVDASGIGDPIVEEFRERQMTVEPFLFTSGSKRALIEGLVVACDKRSITIPSTPAFEVYRRELESMEYEFSGASEVRYAVASGMTDDCVMSLALAVKELESSVSIGPLEIITAGPDSRAAQLGRWY